MSHQSLSLKQTHAMSTVGLGLYYCLRISRLARSRFPQNNESLARVPSSLDAYEAARKLYSYVKAASESGAPGSDSIAAELKKRFVRRKASPQENDAKRKS